MQCGGRHLLPKRQEPIVRDIVGQLDGLRIVPPQLLANPIGQAGALLLQLVGDARPLAQLDHQGIIDHQSADGLAVGTQRAAKHTGVAAVILGASDREAIAETVELLGIDGEDQEGVIEQHLHHGTVRGLDRHCDLSRRGFGLLKQPIAQLCQPGSAMREVALIHMSSLDIKQADAVALRCPVDPDEPLYIVDHC